MKRFSQKKIDSINNNDIETIKKLIEYSKKHPDKCQFSERREIKKEVYAKCTLYAITFIYCFSFEKTWLYDEEYVEFTYDEKLKFESKEKADDYINCVEFPSSFNFNSLYKIDLKEKYLNIIVSATPYSSTPYSLYNGFENVAYVYTVSGYYNAPVASTTFSTLEKMRNYLRDAHKIPVSVETIETTITKSFSDINIEEIEKEIEQLKNEKNKLVTNEIHRSAQYILTLKKLL